MNNKGTRVTVKKLPACDFASFPNSTCGPAAHPAGYDGATKLGPWANMCEVAFQSFGLGLGTGRGQALILERKSIRQRALEALGDPDDSDFKRAMSS